MSTSKQNNCYKTECWDIGGLVLLKVSSGEWGGQASSKLAWLAFSRWVSLGSSSHLICALKASLLKRLVYRSTLAGLYYPIQTSIGLIAGRGSGEEILKSLRNSMISWWSSTGMIWAEENEAFTCKEKGCSLRIIQCQGWVLFKLNSLHSRPKEGYG
jgi:hypothetical protein